MKRYAALFQLLSGLGTAVACTGQSSSQDTPGASLPSSNGTPPGASVPAAGASTAATPPGPTTSPADSPAVGGAGPIAAGTGGAPPAMNSTGGVPADPVASSPFGGAPSTMPGAAGSPASGVEQPSSLIGDVTFSVPSGTFEGSLSVTMTSATAGAQIRYTTDGLLPTGSSTPYDGGPLALTETTQLRAQTFDGETATGLPSTAIYIRRTFDVSSDIPIVIMEGYGSGKPPADAGAEKVIFRDLAFMLFEPVDGVAAISAAPSWASRAGYHVRGQSSARFEKTPYRVELWDNHDEDADYPMIGMPADSDWAMVGPYTDKTLIRNAFIYSLAPELGLAALEIRFAEVYLNQDGGPLEPGDYFGVYAVTETVKNMTGRVDLKQLRPEDTTEPDISGGYIFKFDQAAVREDEGEIEIFCSSGVTFADGGSGDCYTDLELTDPVAPNAEQLAWIQAYIQQLHDALHEEPIGNYSDYMDVPSFVDQFLLNELTKGGDKYTRSVYMHKERDGLVTAGPVWDYNFTMGNYTRDVEGWQLADSPGASNDWFQILFAQPDFFAAAATRWRELRQGVFSDAALEERIALVRAPLVNAGPRDLERWPVGEATTGFGDQVDEDAPTTWEGQVEALLQWLRDRTVWLDEQFAG